MSTGTLPLGDPSDTKRLSDFETMNPCQTWAEGVENATSKDSIIVGDSSYVLKSFSSEFVDLIHTSPPYNIEKPYAHTSDNLEHEQYLLLLRDVFSECFRILKPNASLFLQTGYCHNSGSEVFPIDMLMYDTMRELGFQLWDRIIWHYRGGVSLSRKFKNSHETILWWVKPNQNKNIQPYFEVDAVREKSLSYDKRNNLYGKNPGNVWSVDRVAFGGLDRNTTHIAIYPESITERIIRACSRKHSVVLDPFAGSGTTPAMARSLGRHWIGVEISPTYAREAELRIGRKQTSEVGSLASSVLKYVGFGNKIGTLTKSQIAKSFEHWCTNIDLTSFKLFVEENLDRRVAEATSEKEVKPEIWQTFDNLFRRGNPRFENLLLVSALLDATYPQRRLWNSVRKYLHSLDTLGALIELSGSDLELLIESVIHCEPGSFHLKPNNAIEFTGPRLRLIQPQMSILRRKESAVRSQPMDSDPLGLDRYLENEP